MNTTARTRSSAVRTIPVAGARCTRRSSHGKSTVPRAATVRVTGNGCHADYTANGILIPVVDDKSKSQPTPTRKQAQDHRRARMKTPASRKEQMRKQRASRNKIRERQRQAMKGEGSAHDLPARDRGAARTLCRDFVDRRLTFAEWLLPVLILIFVLSLIPNPAVVTVVLWLWMATILVTILDEVLLVRALRNEFKRRGFDKSDTRGAVAYTVLRTSQLRRLRMPKPAVTRGDPLKTHY